MKTLHLYDYKRSALEGCAVLCGRDTRGVRWTAGNLTKKWAKTACQTCVRIYRKREGQR